MTREERELELITSITKKIAEAPAEARMFVLGYLEAVHDTRLKGVANG